jgi:hypothetical protein
MSLPTFSLMHMFPAFDGPHQLDERHIELLELCAYIDIPFPAERNRSYGTWWHSLHEIGHWAVKPDWYIGYSRYLLDDLATTWGQLIIPAGTVPGVHRHVDIPRIGRYIGGNDVIPEIGLLRDFTPGERETRVWSLQVIKQMGWPHPFEDNTAGVSTGDEHFHKPASARVWLPAQLHDLDIRARMDRWNVNVFEGRYRACPAPSGENFILPFPRPVSHTQMIDNIRAVHDMCGEVQLTSAERADWGAYLRARWPDRDLRHRAERHAA